MNKIVVKCLTNNNCKLIAVNIYKLLKYGISFKAYSYFPLKIHIHIVRLKINRYLNIWSTYVILLCIIFLVPGNWLLFQWPILKNCHVHADKYLNYFCFVYEYIQKHIIFLLVTWRSWEVSDGILWVIFSLDEIFT